MKILPPPPKKTQKTRRGIHGETRRGIHGGPSLLALPHGFCFLTVISRYPINAVSLNQFSVLNPGIKSRYQIWRKLSVSNLRVNSGIKSSN